MTLSRLQIVSIQDGVITSSVIINLDRKFEASKIMSGIELLLVSTGSHHFRLIPESANRADG